MSIDSSVIEIAPLLLKIKHFIDTQISSFSIQSEFHSLKHNEIKIYNEQIKNLDNFLQTLRETETTLLKIKEDLTYDHEYTSMALTNKHKLMVKSLGQLNDILNNH